MSFFGQLRNFRQVLRIFFTRPVSTEFSYDKTINPMNNLIPVLLSVVLAIDNCILKVNPPCILILPFYSLNSLTACLHYHLNNTPYPPDLFCICLQINVCEITYPFCPSSCFLTGINFGWMQTALCQNTVIIEAYQNN